MEKIRYSSYNFEKHIISGLENINNFYFALRNPKTEYFWDLDAILGNSPKSIFDIFNKNNPYKLKANTWEIDTFDYLTKLVENAGYKDHEDLEENWFKNIPLYHAKSYEYARLAMNISSGVAGVENNFILTSRYPKLKRATKLWVYREFPEFDIKNILIRDKNDKRNSTDFKVDSLREHSGLNHHIVLIEDQERYINASLKANNIPNLLVIGIPLGLMRYSIDDRRLLVLPRYPYIDREMLPLFTLFQNAQKSS